MKKQSFFVILHNIRSCYNVGSVFRTADAFGVDKIFLGGYTPSPETNPKEIAKTALGAENYVPWEKVWRTGDLITKFKKQEIKTIALEQAKGSKKLEKFQSQFLLNLMEKPPTSTPSSVEMEMEENPLDTPMPFSDHLAELRIRLIISAVSFL